MSFFWSTRHIPKDAIVVLSEGEYDDYSVVRVVRATEDIDIPVGGADYNNYIASGRLVPIDAYEWHDDTEGVILMSKERDKNEAALAVLTKFIESLAHEAECEQRIDQQKNPDRLYDPPELVGWRSCTCRIKELWEARSVLEYAIRR